MGAEGLDSPPYVFDLDESPALDGALFRSVRGGVRELFLPVRVTGADRGTFVARKRALVHAMSPKRGAGVLEATELDATKRQIACYYVGGMEGEGGITESNSKSQKYPIRLRALDPYWADTVAQTQQWKADAGVAFFPILPLRVNASQVLSGQVTASVTNYFQNPSYETGTHEVGNVFGFTPPIGWVTDTGQFHEGAKSLKVTWDASVGVTGFAQFAYGLTIGQTYTISAWCRVPTGSPAVRLWATFSSSPASPYTSTLDAWERISTSFVATATTQPVSIEAANSDANDILYTDGWMCSDGATLVPYLDGDTSGAFWLGAAHASISRKNAVYDQSQIIDAGGDVEAYPLWTITGPGGSLILHHLDTGQKLVLNAPIAVGQTVTIDTRPQLQTIVDQAGTNLWPYADVGSALWPLQPGSNNVALLLSGANTNSAINLAYTRRWECS
jgi:hypothetical protein